MAESKPRPEIDHDLAAEIEKFRLAYGYPTTKSALHTLAIFGLEYVRIYGVTVFPSREPSAKEGGR